MTVYYDGTPAGARSVAEADPGCRVNRDGELVDAIGSVVREPSWIVDSVATNDLALVLAARMREAQ